MLTHLVGDDVPQAIAGEDDAFFSRVEVVMADIWASDDVALQRPVTERPRHSKDPPHPPCASPDNHTPLCFDALPFALLVWLVIFCQSHNCIVTSHASAAAS